MADTNDLPSPGCGLEMATVIGVIPGVANVHSQRTERLDEVRDLLRRARVDGAAREFRNRRGDIEPQVVRHLLGVADPLVHRVEQQRQPDRAAYAGQQRHGHEPRRGVLRRRQRRYGRVEYPNVGRSARLGELCLRVRRLDGAVDLCLVVDLSPQAHFFDRARRNRLQVDGLRGDSLRVLLLALLELGQQALSEAGNGLGLQLLMFARRSLTVAYSSVNACRAVARLARAAFSCVNASRSA